MPRADWGATSASQIAVSAASIWQKNGRLWQAVDPVRVLALAELMIAGAEFAPLQLDPDGRLCNGHERLAAAHIFAGCQF